MIRAVGELVAAECQEWFVQQYKGKVEGDTTKGKVEFERQGEKMTRDWEAKKS
jgi:hypothetical protein